jgi:Domain of unknown function (DUF4280)
MPKPIVTSGAALLCSFGVAPSTLNVLPVDQVIVEGRPAANISTNAPEVNIPPFGMCMSLANPEVAAATAAALGVLTPMPCQPVPTPWIPSSETMLGGQPALTLGSTCICAFGGVITITFPGSTRSLA